MSKEYRPWGHFITLYSDKYTWLKILVVEPGQRLSAQVHAFRTEMWVPSQSGGTAVIGTETLDLVEGVAYTVPVGTLHRIVNDTDQTLYIMEWAYGLPMEHDIERLEDDYGR